MCLVLPIVFTLFAFGLMHLVCFVFTVLVFFTVESVFGLCAKAVTPKPTPVEKPTPAISNDDVMSDDEPTIDLTEDVPEVNDDNDEVDGGGLPPDSSSDDSVAS